MASSSRSLRSQTLTQLLATYRRVSQRLTTAGRWGRTTLVWATQVALYPLYLVLQSGRRLGQWLPTSPLGQTLRARWRPTPLALTSDAPILACLLSLPSSGQGALDSPGPLDRSLSRFLHRSGARTALVPASWMDRVWPAPLQGIACDLADGQLVLVAATNQVVSDLTAEQRHQLEQAIWLLLAEYGRRHHRSLAAVGLGPVPPPPIAPRLRARWRGTPPALPGDGPILACLLSLPSLGEGALACPGPLDRRFSQFVHRSGARTALVPASWMDRAWSAPLQGIACDLADGQLVLVTATNQVVSDLTAEQRHQLGQAIWLLLAEYGRQHHRSLAGPPFRLGRWLGGALTWMQTSPLAIATNLFGEADQPSPLPPGAQPLALGSPPASALPQGGRRSPVLVTPLKRPRASALPEANALEAEVALLHYVDHPLVILLRLLDSWLHSLETWLRSLWTWLRLRV